MTVPRRRRSLPAPTDLPLYCDFGCPHAGFAPADSVGACRREQAVYCGILRDFNPKHGRCGVRRMEGKASRD